MEAYTLFLAIFDDHSLAIAERFDRFVVRTAQNHTAVDVDIVPALLDADRSNSVAELETAIIERRNDKLLATTIAPQSITSVECRHFACRAVIVGCRYGK